MFLRRLTEILRGKAGFTLAEMMAAMGVFAIVMAIAVPNYLSFQPSRRLNGAAREVLGKLLWARAKAVEENNQYTVSIPNNYSLTIASTGGYNQTINIQTNYSDVTLSKPGSDPNPTFNSRGTASGDTTITLNNSSGLRTVTVRATGYVKIN
jgi:type IV fimbrial biogenesis protein FimT